VHHDGAHDELAAYIGAAGKGEIACFIGKYETTGHDQENSDREIQTSRQPPRNGRRRKALHVFI
jgi:hypothetical protein